MAREAARPLWSCWMRAEQRQEETMQTTKQSTDTTRTSTSLQQSKRLAETLSCQQAV